MPPLEILRHDIFFVVPDTHGLQSLLVQKSDSPCWLFMIMAEIGTPDCSAT